MKKRKFLHGWVFVFILLISFVPVICFAASENDPRDTIPAPGGTDAVLFYYRYISGHKLIANGRTVNDNIDFTANLAFGRYVHYWAKDKWTFAANVIVPFGSESLNVGGVTQTSSGLADTTFVGVTWYNLLSRENNNLWAMLAGYAVAPTGEYNRNSAINLGANRWNYRVELYPIIWKYGPLSVELAGGIDFYTNNTDFTANSVTLKQDPIYTLQTHVAYDITKTFWIAGTYYLHAGGQTTVADVDQRDYTTEHKVVGTLGIHMTPQTQLLLQYATDVAINNGIPTNAIQARFAYFW